MTSEPLGAIAEPPSGLSPAGLSPSGPPVSVPVLERLFATTLGLASAGPETDFYLSGGHSLAALDLAVAIEAETGLRVGVVDILECPTPRALAERLRGAARAGTDRADADRADADRADRAAAGPGPEAPAGTARLGREARWLWLERQRTGRLSEAYTVSCLLTGHGAVDPGRFAAAVRAAAGRHPALHRVIGEDRGEPICVPTGVPEVLEVLRTPDHGAHDIEALAAVAFDPATGPLLRVRLLLGPTAWQVLISADHLVCDGRGLEIVVRDIVQAYNSPDSPAPPPAVPRTPATSPAGPALDYWRDRLTPAPPALPLPVAAPRTGPVGALSALVTREVPAVAVEALVRAGHAALFVPAAAAVARTLADLTGLRDVCVGTAVDRRARTGAEGVVDCLVTTVPLRIPVPAADDARALTAAVAAAAAGAVDHSDASFDEIVAAVDPPRPPGRTPLFDVWVAVFPAVDAPAGPAAAEHRIALHGSPLPVRTAVFELSFQFVRHADGLRLALLYDAARYAPDTAERIADRAVSALAGLADGLVADPDTDPDTASGHATNETATHQPAASEPPALFGGFHLEG